ncbi:hypothetical protein M9Y10_005430 [Tritrichomonas musculus]|uniref:Importin N-terminal domain-containing protein n=1 Tax=Tritrichomonas musculus TaxID=1915356 RepID=A0ABR2JN79_9EUKA
MLQENPSDNQQCDIKQVSLTLRELLIEAQDSDNPNFALAQRVLQEAKTQDPYGFASQLIKEVKDPDVPYNVLFLALVLITHCFSMSVIPISKEHRQLSSSFPSEMISQLIDITFELFLNKHDAIRNTAIHLFTLIAITQVQNIHTLGIDKRLIEMLTGAQSVETILSSTECIWNLMLHHNFSPEEQQIIIQTLFQILSLQNDDTQLIDRCIRLLGSFSYLIPRLFDSEEQFIHFILQIMNFFSCPELKEAVYQFFDSALIYTPALLNIIINPLLASSVDDLMTLTNRNILIKIIVLWESLVTKEIITCHPDFITKVIPQILPPLISIMQTVNTTRVLDYTEWEPYTAAYSCIQAFAVAQPDAVLPLLSNYITDASQSTSPFDREGAIKSLRITFQVASKEILDQITPDSLRLLLMRINDSAPRVRAAVVDCLIVVINARMHECNYADENSSSSSNSNSSSSSNSSGAMFHSSESNNNNNNGNINLFSWHIFAPFVNPLFELGRDVEPTAKQAFEALRLIAKFDDFDQYPIFFQTIVSTIPCLPNSVMPQAIECLSLAVHSNVSKDVIFVVFQFLYNFLMHVLSEWRTYAILDMICKVMSTVLINSDQRVAEYAEPLCNTMYACFKDLSLSNSLTVIASLSFPARDFIQMQIPIFMPLVMEAQSRYNDPGVLIPSIRIVALIVNRLDLSEEIFTQLMNNMFESLKLGETAPAKAEILNVFCILVTKKTEMFRPFIRKLYCGMLYLVTYLENVYQIYLECTAQIVSNICHLCVALIRVVSKEDQHHIFALGIQLINTVVKMPKLLSQINEDLVDVILCLLQNFRDETKQQIQQIPSISEVLRSGLKLVQRSDAEIEQLMSELMNSVQNS